MIDEKILDKLADKYSKDVPDYCDVHNVPLRAMEAYKAGYRAAEASAQKKINELENRLGFLRDHLGYALNKETNNHQLSIGLLPK